MSKHPAPGFLLVSINEAWNARLIEGSQSLFDAGEFHALGRQLDLHRLGTSTVTRLGRGLVIEYAHQGLPCPMVGVLWCPGDPADVPESIHGMFLPHERGGADLTALDALFDASETPHLDQPFHYLVLDARGDVIATNASDMVQRAAANAPPEDRRLEQASTVATWLRVVEGMAFETEHSAHADWEIRHSSDEKPVFQMRPLSAASPELGTVIRFQLVHVPALISQTRDLVQLLDLYKTMLWRMGHNIRTPLNAIYGFWQLQQLERPEKNDKAHSRNVIIRDSIRQINQTIEDAATIPSLHGWRPQQAEPTDLAHALNSALSMSHQAIAAKGIRFDASGPATRVLASLQVLVELFLNLISNAVKFSPPGGAVSVTWRVTQRDDMVSVMFENSVETPDSLRIDHSPTPQRRPHHRPAVPGSGVGLATCGYLLRRMGGDLMPTVIADGKAQSQITLPVAGIHGR